MLALRPVWSLACLYRRPGVSGRPPGSSGRAVAAAPLLLRLAVDVREEEGVDVSEGESGLQQPLPVAHKGHAGVRGGLPRCHRCDGLAHRHVGAQAHKGGGHGRGHLHRQGGGGIGEGGTDGRTDGRRDGGREEGGKGGRREDWGNR